MMKNYFQIAGLVFELSSDQSFEIDQDFKLFQIHEIEHADYKVIYRQVHSLMLREKTLVATDYDNDVYALDDHSFVRQFHLPDKTEIYAISHCLDTKKTEISYLDSGKNVVSKIHQSFRMSCWEAAMNFHNRLLLHASLIDTKYGGILFAGPSGIGKSTQASLWEMYRNARLINGDRPILYKEKKWIAFGSPLAGSSRCCLNESVSVAAVVLLKQAPECSVRRVPQSEAFKRLYSLTTVYSWLPEYVGRVISMIQDLIIDIPVFELSCTPDERAIETLEFVLQGDS